MSRVKVVVVASGPEQPYRKSLQPFWGSSYYPGHPSQERGLQEVVVSNPAPLPSKGEEGCCSKVTLKG